MYEDWSPLQLAHALGVNIDLRHQGGGRVPFIRIGKKDHNIHRYEYAICVLKRWARMRSIKDEPPSEYNRALWDGINRNSDGNQEGIGKMSEDRIAKAADEYVAATGIPHSGGDLEAAFEAGAKWAIGRVESAKNDLCEYVKANKQSVLFGMTQRETDGLLDALHSLNSVAARPYIED